MSYKKRMSLSVDNYKSNIICDQNPQAIRINSTDKGNLKESRYNLNVSNTKSNSTPTGLSHQVKKLNFKAINL